MTCPDCGAFDPMGDEAAWHKEGCTVNQTPTAQFPMGSKPTDGTVAGGPSWGTRAERLLEQALGEVRDNIDAIPTVDAALTALRIEAGEVSADVMDGYHFPGEDDSDDGCTCPPGLVARGGWSSQCPVHGGLHV